MKRSLPVPIVIVIAAALIGAAGVSGCSRRPKDEVVIATQLSDLSKDLSVTGHENDLVRAARASRLRRYFIDNVQIEFGPDEPPIDGLDTLITTAAKFEIPMGGIQVAFVDLRISVEKDHKHANAVTTLRATRQDPADGKVDVDAREMQIELERRMDFWMISRVAPVETLQRMTESVSGPQ